MSLPSAASVSPDGGPRKGLTGARAAVPGHFPALRHRLKCRAPRAGRNSPVRNSCVSSDCYSYARAQQTEDPRVAQPDSYDLTAAYYSARTPYLPGFFSYAADALGLSKQSFALDLACGSGELAVGFAPYCRSILAIDKSPHMLSGRRGHPENVRFLEADVNAGIGPFPDLAELLTIGR